MLRKSGKQPLPALSPTESELLVKRLKAYKVVMLLIA